MIVKKGESLRLVFGAMLHDGKDYDPAGEDKHFLDVVKTPAVLRVAYALMSNGA